MLSGSPMGTFWCVKMKNWLEIICNQLIYNFVLFTPRIYNESTNKVHIPLMCCFWIGTSLLWKKKNLTTSTKQDLWNLLPAPHSFFLLLESPPPPPPTSPSSWFIHVSVMSFCHIADYWQKMSMFPLTDHGSRERRNAIIKPINNLVKHSQQRKF